MGAKNIQELADSFALFDSWEHRYRYLIELGQRLPPMDENLKTDEHLIKGCTSRVWMVARVVENENGEKTFTFMADSDAQIVKGLVYILYLAYQNCPLSQIGEINIEDAFEELGLSSHLSPNRRNGFFAMVSYIKSIISQA